MKDKATDINRFIGCRVKVLVACATGIMYYSSGDCGTIRGWGDFTPRVEWDNGDEYFIEYNTIFVIYMEDEDG